MKRLNALELWDEIRQPIEQLAGDRCLTHR
jgi:hypothetical protein